jgi:hypothetical protein
MNQEVKQKGQMEIAQLMLKCNQALLGELPKGLA